MKKIYLYIKESPLGLKYLGITNKDPYKYKGSGLYWKRHLNFYNIDSKNIKTIILFETFDKNELKEKALYYSFLYDIVNSKEWANIIPESGIGTFGFKFSEDSKSKMNLSKKGIKLSDNHKAKLSLASKGKSKSENFKQNRRGDKNPFYGKTHSKETIDKIIKANTGKKIPIEQTIKSILGRSKGILQYTLNDEFIKEWLGAWEIQKELGFNSSCITGCCKGRYKKSNGFKWRYKNEKDKTNSQLLKKEKNI